MSTAFANRVETYQAGWSTTLALPATSHTAGGLVVVFVTQSVYSSLPNGVSDTAGNTYADSGFHLATGGGHSIGMWYAVNITGSASNVITVTWGSSVAERTASALHFTGMATSPADDLSKSAQADSASISSGTVTVSASEDILVGFFRSASGGVTAGSGFTATAITGAAINVYDIYKVGVTSSDAITATQTSGWWTILAASFKGGTAAATPVPVFLGLCRQYHN